MKLLVFLILFATGCGSSSSLEVPVFLSLNGGDPAIYFQAGNIYSLFVYQAADPANAWFSADFNGSKRSSVTFPKDVLGIPVWIRVIVANAARVPMFDGYYGGPANLVFIEQIAAVGMQIPLFPTGG